MTILNIAGYKFIELNDLELLRDGFIKTCGDLHIKGTILLSDEGININIAGSKDAISAFKAKLKQDARFANINFHHAYSDVVPFQHLKIKLRDEIITLRQPEVDATATRAPSLSPETLKQWLDENRPLTLLDTRNHYEMRFGTFRGAVNLHLNDFSELPDAIKKLNTSHPIVMFCTGGIRCEKAGLYMLNNGFASVYQLDGGILGYFARVGGAHYEGECFVFDERVAVDSNLRQTGTVQCRACQGPVTRSEQQLPSYIPNVCCPSCQTLANPDTTHFNSLSLSR